MNLEELRAMKEKTDSIVATLQNDRKVLREVKEKIIADNSKDLNSFLLTLCDYAKLISVCPSNTYKNVSWLFEDFEDKHGHRAFYREDIDLWLGKDGTNPYLRFCCSGSEEGYEIYIYADDRVFFIPNKHKHNYSENEFKKFVLNRKDNVRKAVEDFIQYYFELIAEQNKKENDTIYADIEKLNREE